MKFRANKLRIWRDLCDSTKLSLGAMGLLAWLFFAEREIESFEQIPVSKADTPEAVKQYFDELIKEGYLSYE